MTPGVSPEEEGTYFDPWSFQSQTCGQRRWLVTGPSIPRTPFALCHATREEFAFCFFISGRGWGNIRLFQVRATAEKNERHGVARAALGGSPPRTAPSSPNAKQLPYFALRLSLAVPYRPINFIKT